MPHTAAVSISWTAMSPDGPLKYIELTNKIQTAHKQLYNKVSYGSIIIVVIIIT